MLWLNPLRLCAAVALSLLVSGTGLVRTTVRAQSDQAASHAPPRAVDAPAEPSPTPGAPPRAAVSAPGKPASPVALPLDCHCNADGAAVARERTLSERLLLRQQWLMYRERERRQISLVVPLLGTLVGSAALGTSVWLFTEGQAHRVVGTMVSVFVAVPLLTASLIHLVRRVKKRRAIEHEVWAAPPLARGPLSWVF